MFAYSMLDQWRNLKKICRGAKLDVLYIIFLIKKIIFFI